MTAYYNEYDPHAAQWLRNLIYAGHIAPGIVDERSIEDVFPSDLRGFTQCHFFAGIGVWSYAARRAGWPDDRPVWTGSCPCQPFSAAGKGLGVEDERHLWPSFHHLIAQCRPPVVLGEQVASKDGLAWLDAVLADLEDTDYAAGAVDLCAAGFGAPHIRQRLYWMADAGGPRLAQRERVGRIQSGALVALAGEASIGSRAASRLADTHGGDTSAEGLQRRGQHGQQSQNDAPSGLADAGGERREGQRLQLQPGEPRPTGAKAGWSSEAGGPGPVNGFWRAADWLGCTDGSWRPVEPGTFPLAHGVAGRVGQVRAYGNAINAEQARIFFECVKEIL